MLLLTGGSPLGLGGALARALTQQGVRVLLTAPSAAGAASAARSAASGSPGAATGFVLDQRSSAGVSSFVRELRTTLATNGWRLRGVVLNAACFSPAACNVNALGTLSMLTQLHAAQLLSPECRLVLVGSFTARCVSPAQLRSFLARPPPPAAAAYARSKAAAMAAATAFARINGLELRVADPGLVATRLTRGWPTPLSVCMSVGGGALGLCRVPARGAGAVLAALGAEGRCEGRCFFGEWGVRLLLPPAGGGDAALAAEAWRLTEKLLGDF